MAVKEIGDRTRRYHVKVVGLPPMSAHDRADVVTCVQSCVTAATGTDTVPDNVTVEIPDEEIIVTSVIVEPLDGTVLSDETHTSLQRQLALLIENGVSVATGKPSRMILTVAPPPGQSS